jgi:hypothetical protein
MAQLVAHHTGSVGVRGSSPLSSTGQTQVSADGKQSLMSFDDHAKAVQFKDLVNRVGPAKAMDVLARATSAKAP